MISLRELTVVELKEQLDRCARQQEDSPEAQIVYELQIYQIELEIQNRELREAQQRLQISRNRYAELYDFAPIGYLSLTPKGVICEINMTAAILLDTERNHLLGYPLFYFVESEYRAHYLDHLQRCRDSERTVTELMLRAHDKSIPVELISRQYDDLEYGIVYRTAILDIGERKRNEAMLRRANETLDQRVRERTVELESVNNRLQDEVQLKEKMGTALHQHARELDELHKRKDEFLAMLAHELRNPLAPLTNGLHLLKSFIHEGNESEIAQCSDMMERQLKQVVRLVDDLLDVSRVMSGKISLHKQSADLRDIVRYAIEQCGERIHQRNHQLELRLPDEPIAIEADEVRLQQAVVNLLNNAAKFTAPRGYIQVKAQIERNEAVLRVIDNGPGISRELLPHIFDLFTQGESTLDRSSGGLGIGLTLANSLVQMHGGYIQAFSGGEDCGAEFVIRLPLHERTLVAPTFSAENSTHLHSEVQQRILVVDDNEDMARSTVSILRVWGHTVECAHSGIAALERLDEFKPNTVLLDIGLPEMDGYAVAQCIRERPDGAAITLIGISGYSAADYKQHAMDVGFDGYLVKPVDLQQLRNYLHRSQSIH